MGISMPKKKQEDFEIFDDNWDIVMMFLRMQTQWNVSMNGVIGLKYESLNWLCKLYLVKDCTFMFEGIRTMEAQAIRLFNKKDD
jgi:hypothetical protein|nr:hypothetical protein [uncultured Mediterranean phage uvMED]